MLVEIDRKSYLSEEQKGIKNNAAQGFLTSKEFPISIRSDSQSSPTTRILGMMDRSQDERK